MAGLIDAIVMGGAQGYRNAVNKDTENQADIDKKKQLMDMELEAKDMYAQRLAERGVVAEEAAYQKGRARLPERISDEGLISAGKRTDEVAAWNDPEYIKAQSRKESITNPDRGAGLRAIQTEMAGLQLARAKEENKMSPAETKMFDSYGKQAEQINAAVTKAQAEGNFSLETGQPLLDKLAALTEAQRKIIQPHLPASKKPDAALDVNKYRINADAGKPQVATPAASSSTLKAAPSEQQTINIVRNSYGSPDADMTFAAALKSGIPADEAKAQIINSGKFGNWGKK